MSPEKLEEIKKEVQKILDNHLEENERFSIEELDEEGTFLLIDLLREKDDDKRQEILKEIEGKLSNSQMNLRITYENVLMIKDELDTQKNDVRDLDDLKGLINADEFLNDALSK